MIRLARCLQVFLILALLAGCAPRPQTSAWLVRYDIENPAEVTAACQAARAAKLDTLLVQARGRGDAFYRSDIAPRPEPPAAVAPDFDPLAATLTACAPVPVQAWLNVFFLWGDTTRPASPRHPVNLMPQAVLRDDDGRPLTDYSGEERARAWVEGIYADPASEEYRRLFVRVVEELVDRYPVAGIHLDFVRYPGPGFGQSGVLGARFREQWGLDPRLIPTPLLTADLTSWLAGDMEPGDRVLTTAGLLWAAARAQAVTDLVRAVHEALAGTGRPLTLSAAVLADRARAYRNNGQDWLDWSEDGIIDALYPMTYFGGLDRVGGQLRDLALTLRPDNPVRLWAGLGAYLKKPAGIGAEAAMAAELGLDGVSLFSLGHLLAKPQGPGPYFAALRSAMGPRRPRPAPV